jgi:hypothetical protein
VNIADPRGPLRGRGDGSEPVADVLARAKARVDKENSRRRKLLSGTVEDHWQEALREETINEMTRNHYVRDDKLNKLVDVSKMSDELRAFHAKNSFYYHFGRKREAVRGLPDNTAVMADINGVSCVQEDRYEWRLKPVSYRNTTDGGLRHRRLYLCPVSEDLYIKIAVLTRVAPSIRIDSDALVKPLLASFQWP